MESHLSRPLLLPQDGSEVSNVSGLVFHPVIIVKDGGGGGGGDSFLLFCLCLVVGWLSVKKGLFITWQTKA